MGHEKIADLLERDGECSAELWASRGIEIVFVKIDGRKYDIPMQVLKEMVGYYFQLELVEQIEQMSGCEIVDKLMKF